MTTERQYLISMGLAVEGRGRFSNKGKEALAAARKQGMTFEEVGPAKSSTPRVINVKQPKAKASEPVNPGAVRQWAKDNGIEVSERGRVSEEIKIRYLESTTPEQRKGVEQPKADSYGEPSYRYSEDTVFEGTDSAGGKHQVDGKQACTCGYSLMGHVCDKPSAIIVGKNGTERIDVRPVGIKGK